MHQQNELGGRVYPPEFQELIHRLAIRLKSRDDDHLMKGLAPSQYMKYYVKAAGILVGCGLRLSYRAPGGPETKSFESWLETLTGLKDLFPMALRYDDLLLEEARLKLNKPSE